MGRKSRFVAGFAVRDPKGELFRVIPGNEIHIPDPDPDAAMNNVEVSINGEILRPAYGSKGDGFELGPGDWVQVRTPGGGGYGDPSERPRELVRRDLRCGYFSEAIAESDYGYVP
ncbi:MAG: hypothetical protein V3V86_10580 [Gammaproteobacteria bacterium]